MVWATVADFMRSDAFKRNDELHGMDDSKLRKLLAAFNAIFTRAKRNGASDEKAESLAWPIAVETAKRVASSDTLSRLEPTRHYFAAMSSLTAQRAFDSGEVVADEYKFGLVRNAKDIISGLVSGLAINWDHSHDKQIGAIHSLVMREDLPPEVLAAADKDVQVFFVASYRNDIPPESRNETGISSEWLATKDKEAIPLTFAASHSPLNAKELGIHRLDIAVASMLNEKPAEASPVTVETSSLTLTQTVTTDNSGASGTVVAITIPKQKTDAKPPMDNHAMSFVEERGSKPPEESPPMPDADEATASMFETKIASLNTELDTERKARKTAELNYAAMKAEFETTKRVVDELKAAAEEQMAEMAAMSLVHEGKATADQASYFAGLYRKIGRQEFEQLVASMPRSALGAYAIKAAAQVIQTPEQLKAHKDRMERLLKE